MSQYFYVQKLKEVIEKDLPALIELDRQALDAKPVKNERVFHGRVYTLYIKYMQLINKLGDCCDQVVQPQKLPTIRKLYEMSVGRLLELKNQLVELDKSDFSYNDNILNEMKLTIFDLVINPPYHLAREREREMKEREEILEELYKQAAEASQKALEESQAMIKEGEEEEGEGKDEEGHDELKVMEADKEHETSPEVKDKITVTAHPEPFKETTVKIPEEDEEDKHPKEVTIIKESASEELRKQEKKYSDAALLIQKHERARQDYDRFLEMKARRYKKELNKLYKSQHGVMDKHATVLQALWRGYRDYKMVEHRKLGEYINLLGMYRTCWQDMEPFKSYWQLKQDKQRKLRERLHLVQDKNEKEYHKTEEDIYSKYLNYQSMWTSHELTTEIRQWFIDWYYATNHFPPIFPTAEIGGSKLISEGQMPIPEKKDEEQEKEKMQKEKKERGGKKTPKKDTKGIEEKKPETAKDKEKDKSQGFTLKESEFINELESVYNEHVLMWSERNESKKDMQPFYIDTITKEQHSIADDEIRREVDERMRLELKDLQMLDRSMKFKKKKSGKKKTGEKKVGGKKKGKKRKKDLTGDRTEIEMLQELYENKIIIQYPRIYLSSFVGEPSYNSYELRKKLKDPLPGLGEMRQLIAENIVLPMVSKNIRNKIPLVKSLCIFGPDGFGKKTLLYSACTEVGALLFDLTPENIFEKYSGKKDIVILMNILSKVSKMYQPSIIFINGGHKMFYKKIPKTERKYKAKNLGKPLMKFLKSIKTEDQVLLLATSDKPWTAKPRPFKKLFEKFILLPKPEYRTMSYCLDETIMSYCNVPRDFTTSALAKVCDCYSIDVVTKAIAEVMTPNRQLQLYTRPLDQQEFLDKILQYSKISDKEMDKYIEWYKKWTDLGVMREEYLRQQQEILEQKQRETKR